MVRTFLAIAAPACAIGLRFEAARPERYRHPFARPGNHSFPFARPRSHRHRSVRPESDGNPSAQPKGHRHPSAQRKSHRHPSVAGDDDDDGVGLDLLTHMKKRRGKEEFPATWFYKAGCDIFTSAEACAARNRTVTWLASSPGSGSTWLRVLLQATTGIYTGSKYNDGQLRKAGLLGEGHTDPSEVLGVKEHDLCSKLGDEPALVVVRHPLHAALAEASRRCGRDHSSEVPYETLRAYFTKQRTSTIGTWEMHARSWMKCQGKKLFVKYEDIQNDTYGVYVNQILPFFDIDTSREPLLQRLAAAVNASNSNRATRRKHTYKFKFTAEDRDAAQRAVGDIMEHYGYGPVYSQ